MIKIIDLKKSFGEVEVLKGIDVEFEKGKTNLIIGQSGSGKTVFLKCMLGLHTPTSGDILYDGVSYKDMNAKDLKKLRSNIGTVFQGSALFDTMNVYENVEFPMIMLSDISEKERKDRVLEILERVGLSGANKKMPSELSGGMQKRVAIARAIVMNPNYLFCDEPNSGLDPNTSIIIDTLIQEITKEYNITTIINTHDMNSVLEIGEKIIFLKNGKKEWEGDKEQITNSGSQAVDNFVYSSHLMRKIKSYL